MAIGRWHKELQAEFSVPTPKICRRPGNVFYDKVNELLTKSWTNVVASSGFRGLKVNSPDFKLHRDDHAGPPLWK